eukprot:TRINITY_DN97408_c0_g1_i1.p1 TRINITY_DN97408_c0_g1~~TRINITY_DN97408_c0_g1_i1.p1  ORF type:complete len:348 (+),score=42.53 TRINITY_DN97408_c0_g1_i1:116-1159(+)
MMRRASQLPKRLSRCFCSPKSLASAVELSQGIRRLACLNLERRYSTGTALGRYLESCGANWGDAYEAEEIKTSSNGQSFSWRVDMPPQRIALIRTGDPIESPTFTLPNGCRGRFQLFPKGDSNSAEGFCSLWFCTDSESLGKVRLKLGASDSREGGSSDFCRLEDAVRGDAIEVSLDLEEAPTVEKSPEVEQSLRLQELEQAEWNLFRADRLLQGPESKPGHVISSPPFRFHHVLLGDMYLEVVPGVPHAEHCAVFFRCRVPTMQLRVSLSVGTSFCKSIIAVGRNTAEADLQTGQFLQVNLLAPGVLAEDGSFAVKCSLEEVVAIPLQLQEMIPKLDERANWPKRI